MARIGWEDPAFRLRIPPKVKSRCDSFTHRNMPPGTSGLASRNEDHSTIPGNMFKRRSAQVLELLVAHRYENTEGWISGDVTYACMFGLQFSFHNLRAVLR